MVLPCLRMRGGAPCSAMQAIVEDGSNGIKSTCAIFVTFRSGSCGFAVAGIGKEFTAAATTVPPPPPPPDAPSSSGGKCACKGGKCPGSQVCCTMQETFVCFRDPDTLCNAAPFCSIRAPDTCLAGGSALLATACNTRAVQCRQ